VNVRAPQRWLSILENSLDEVSLRNFCNQYALLFRGPKQRRSRCLYLVGESQCGKSSLLAPLEGIFGRENIGIPSRDKKFSLEDLVGKRIGILDEFSRSQLSREEFLLLAEGQPMKISMKYHKNPRMNTPPHVLPGEFFIGSNYSVQSAPFFLCQTTSWVWSFFKKLNETEVQCVLCKEGDDIKFTWKVQVTNRLQIT
jgi:hypothetical protein